MTTTTADELRDHLTDLLAMAQFAGERIVVTRHGEPIAAIISIDDLEVLRAIEDRIDQEAAAEALKEAAEFGTVPWEDVREGRVTDDDVPSRTHAASES